MGAQRRRALVAWIAFFASRVLSGGLPDDRSFFAALGVVAEAAAAQDRDTLSLAFEGFRSLREHLPEHPSRQVWEGRLWAAETLAWLCAAAQPDDGRP